MDSSKASTARLRDELLDGDIFYTLREAQIIIESWQRHYNTGRPHASLGYLNRVKRAHIWDGQAPTAHAYTLGINS